MYMTLKQKKWPKKLRNKNVLLAVTLLFLFFSTSSCSNQEKEGNLGKEESPKEQKASPSVLQNGDIVFQTSKSRQSKAIQLATKSKYSHMGIVYIKGSEHWVYEAVEPVKLTRLKDWTKRGMDNHYAIKRLKNATKVLTKEVLQQMKSIGEKYKGKHYDLYFEWSDDKIYCSELVWKIYKEATGIELGALAELRSFDLSNPIVQEKIKERYKGALPLDEKVISPAAMFESTELITIKTN
jgi:uncharacterized protein YycO